MTYSRIPESDYLKLLFQLRGQMAAILNVFNCYGLNNDVTQAIGECVKVARTCASQFQLKPLFLQHLLRVSL